MKDALRVRLFLPLLLAYMVVVVVAALPDPLRPQIMDRPQASAAKLLASIGWRAGQPVFTGWDNPKKAIRAFCTHVKARGEASGDFVLWPPDERCDSHGFRYRMNPREIVHFQSFYSARKQGMKDAALLRGLGRRYCLEAHRRDAEVSAVAFVHYAVMVAYADGALSVAPLQQFEWSCEGGGAERVALVPSQSEMRAFWGERGPWE